MFSSKKLFFLNSNEKSNIVVRLLDQITEEVINDASVNSQGTGIVHSVNGSYFWGRKDGFNTITGLFNSSSVVDYQPLEIQKYEQNFILKGLKGKNKGDNHWVYLYSPNHYPRITFIDIPFSEGSLENPLEISLIPLSFNIEALNELVRDSWYTTDYFDNSLQRWTSKPKIVVLNKLLSFSQGTPWENYYQIKEGSILQNIDVDRTINEIVSNINIISPWTYSTNEIEVINPSVNMNLKQYKTIIVAYYNDIMTWSSNNSSTTAAGYGAHSKSTNSSVFSGHAMIDYNYTSKYRTLIHEIGHCLGYNHVKSSNSIMNSPSNPISLFDHQVKNIVYTRSLASKTPDIDYSLYSISSNIDFPYLYNLESGESLYFPNKIPSSVNFNKLNNLQIEDQKEIEQSYDYIIGCGINGSENKLIYKNNKIIFSSSNI